MSGMGCQEEAEDKEGKSKSWKKSLWVSAT